MFFGETPGNKDGGALPGVPRIGLEGESQQADALSRQGVEHGCQHAHDKAFLLVDVDPDDPFPVICDFLEAIKPAEIDKVKDILLEAGASETDACVEKLGA